ncbi:MAG: hypothetical protein ACYTBX_15060, partial [Planctomycetota bacterium]
SQGWYQGLRVSLLTWSNAQRLVLCRPWFEGLSLDTRKAATAALDACWPLSRSAVLGTPP